MAASPRAGNGVGSARRGRSRAGTGNVFDLDHARILHALARRRRYKYVRPRVEREGDGWKIVSPNCSRTVDSAGGEIEIAWLVPQSDATWQLHARDHRRQCWMLKAVGLSLADALARICTDPAREYWQ